MPILCFQPLDAFAEVHLCTELARLRGELIDEVLRKHSGEPADVEDQLLRIQRLELTT